MNKAELIEEYIKTQLDFKKGACTSTNAIRITPS